MQNLTGDLAEEGQHQASSELPKHKHLYPEADIKHSGLEIHSNWLQISESKSFQSHCKYNGVNIKCEATQFSI